MTRAIAPLAPGSATRGSATPGSAAKLAVQIDRIRCDGYGMCAELLPESIVLDDWGYPIIRPGALPDDLVGLARRAVDVCPVLALGLRRYQDPAPIRRAPAASAPREPDHRAIR